mgnify:CR=1 FL=1
MVDMVFNFAWLEGFHTSHQGVAVYQSNIY